MLIRTSQGSELKSATSSGVIVSLTSVADDMASVLFGRSLRRVSRKVQVSTYLGAWRRASQNFSVVAVTIGGDNNIYMQDICNTSLQQYMQELQAHL